MKLKAPHLLVTRATVLLQGQVFLSSSFFYIFFTRHVILYFMVYAFFLHIIYGHFQAMKMMMTIILSKSILSIMRWTQCKVTTIPEPDLMTQLEMLPH